MIEREAEVFDLGYQHYTGPREGRNRARLALFENGVRTVLGVGRGGRAKILPALLFFGVMSPAVVFVIILSFIGEAGADFIPGPADYYGIVGVVLIIFAAIMAPELLGPDRRDNVLPLYLVRPLTSNDYILARFLAFFAIALALVYAGQIVLQAGLVLTAESQVDYVRDNWTDALRILFVGILVALFISVAPMAVASLTTRRAYAAAAVIAGYLLTTTVVNSLMVESCTVLEVTTNDTVTASTGREECSRLTGEWAPYIGLLDVGSVTDNITVMVFDTQPEGPSMMAVDELNNAWPIVAYLAFTGLPALLLWNRYRRIRL